MLLLSAIFLFWPALTLADPGLRPYNQTAIFVFVKSDANGDGYLEISELDFKGHDTNGDGQISPSEYNAYLDLHLPRLNGLGHALYDVYDINNDHRLDIHDFENFYRLMDGDGDAAVSRDEFVSFFSVLFDNLEHFHYHNHDVQADQDSFVDFLFPQLQL